MVLTILAAVSATAIAASLVMPNSYTAAASVLVDLTPDLVAGAGTPTPLAEVMQTQEDIASSERVAQRVVQLLRLDEDPKYREKWEKSTGGRGDIAAWLAKSLSKSISVPATIESNVLTIVAKSSDPKFASTLANSVAQAYIDTTVELKMQPAKQYSALFDETARALRAELEEKQRLLSDYENSRGFIADDRLDIENARLTELSTQLVAIQGQLQDSQSKQHAVIGGDDSRPEILQNALIASLKSDLSHAEALQDVLATQLGVSHPDYLRNQAQIHGLRDRLGRENARIVASLEATTQANQRRLNDVSAAVAAQKQRILELKHQRDEASVLQNDIVTAQRNLDAVTQRLGQTNLQARTPQATVALLTSASAPLERSSPNLLLNLAVGIILGVIAGVGTALLLESGDRRVRSDTDLVQVLGLPLLGKMTRIRDLPRSNRPLLPELGTRRAFNG